MIGLTDKTDVKEKIVVVDKTNAIKYTVVEEEIDVAQLKSELEYAKARLIELPPEPSDADLLAWAKENYPRMDYSVERASLEKIVVDNEAVLQTLVAENSAVLEVVK